jgi:hypothetical protein
MAKEKSIHAYELEIRKMIEKRVGTFEIWLKPQVEATAMNRAMLNKVHNELIKTDTDLMLISPGSQGQMKQEAHPLLSHYKELQRTLILQYEALGLSYKATPSKIKEDTRKGVDEEDPMANYYKDRKQ